MDSVRHDINNKFSQRCSPVETLGATSYPVNPFATVNKQNANTKRDEMKVRPSVSLPETLGAQYNGHVIDTKNDDSVRLDTYSVRENPKSNTIKHSKTRLQVEHTRER